METSIKEMIQGMMPVTVTVARGTVKSIKPVEIMVDGDEKLVLSEMALCIPKHLSDYTALCDIQLGAGGIDSLAVGGEHSGHTGGNGSHSNYLQTFNVFSATITVYNSLKKGDRVFLLSFNEGKKYYVMDRES